MVAQIETAGALRDLDRIVTIPSLDSLVIGPQDLSGSLGMLGQLDHPLLLAAIRRIISAGREARLYIGIRDHLFGRAPIAETELGMTRPKPIQVTSGRVAMRFGRGVRIRPELLTPLE